MPRIQLTDGQWADLIDSHELTNGQRRPIIIASEVYRKKRLDPLTVRELQKAVARKDYERRDELLTVLSIDDDELDELMVADVLITVLVRAWSLDLPLPSSMPKHDGDGMLVGSEVLDNLRAHDYDALRWATARIMPDLKAAPGPQTRPTLPSGAQRKRSGAAVNSRKSSANTKR